MEFLVRFEITVPPELSGAELEAIMAEERKRGEELWATGRLKRMWRIPGRRASIALYDFADATELHDTFASFPLFPHMTVSSVEPLALHPVEAERNKNGLG